MPDLQILAVTRFAYPGLGGYQVEHETVEERQAHLWEPARMEARFRSLEHISLRTLTSQSDDSFRTIVVTGDALPEPWRSRLVSLVSGLKGGEVVFHPARHHRDAMRDVILPRIDPEGPPSMQFRHDDDDGVARRFIARCREVWGHVHPLWEHHKRLAIDFNRGMNLHLTRQGPLVEERFETHLGVAQAIILAPNNQRTGMHFPHHRIGTLMPSVTLPDAAMWLRGVDGTNDSRIKTHMDRLKPADDAQKRMLRRRFTLDLKAIRQSF
ncbi:Putative rhamnosyl transferase [Jannaschia faecimaris]|uniref:Putative rhamnosyl transferase n=1 Tax=Jannaschia faecimaris TaxID=1244108 RepID=A0A1H3UJQ4_9RHOB|nr:glycosyltransferase [Jannaschia faecimaris]SDZ62624.1 Putative rhamnosyl transferase [Jannaschia faecimaris]